MRSVLACALVVCLSASSASAAINSQKVAELLGLPTQKQSSSCSAWDLCWKCADNDCQWDPMTRSCHDPTDPTTVTNILTCPYYPPFWGAFLNQENGCYNSIDTCLRSGQDYFPAPCTDRNCMTGLHCLMEAVRTNDGMECFTEAATLSTSTCDYVGANAACNAAQSACPDACSAEHLPCRGWTECWTCSMGGCSWDVSSNSCLEPSSNEAVTEIASCSYLPPPWQYLTQVPGCYEAMSACEEPLQSCLSEQCNQASHCALEAVQAFDNFPCHLDGHSYTPTICNHDELLAECLANEGECANKCQIDQPVSGCADNDNLVTCQALANPATCASSIKTASGQDMSVQDLCPQSCGCCERAGECICNNNNVVSEYLSSFGIHSCGQLMAIPGVTCSNRWIGSLVSRICPCHCALRTKQ